MLFVFYLFIIKLIWIFFFLKTYDNVSICHLFIMHMANNYFEKILINFQLYHQLYALNAYNMHYLLILFINLSFVK